MIGAVDIGGTKIAVGMIDDTGRVRSRLDAPTEPDSGYSSALDRITAMLHEAAFKAECEITGIGIGSTGPLHPMAGEFGNVNFFPAWEGENPVRDLEERFHVKVAMENDADAAALGEAGWGAGRNKSRLIYVTVGTGIGGGVLLDGRVYRGVRDSHPELGHHLVDPSGPACVCGFHGCWESLAAGPAMVSWLQSIAPSDYPYHSGLTAKRICELARQGDPLARQAVERETYYLGLGLANLVTLFSPDAIVLGGSVMKSASLFLDGIRKLVRENCKLVPSEPTKISLASLGDDSNLIGAARVWHYRFGSEGGSVLSEFSVIEGPYLRDILDQPRALENTSAHLEVSATLESLARKLHGGGFCNLVLTGMGSSFHALHPMNLALIDQGFTPVMVETGELVHYMKPLFEPKTLMIAVSQSGQSAEMGRLLEMNHRRAAVIAVTNTEESPLANCADATVFTRAGHEFSVSCKTYVTALMALEWLIAILCKRDLGRTQEELKQACPSVQAYLSDWKQHVESLTKLFKGTRQLFLVGRGPSLAAVETGALIVKESDHFPAEGMSSAAFRHGPFEMLSEEILVIVFAGDERTRSLNDRLVKGIRQQGGRAELVGVDAALAACKLAVAPHCVQPILEILPVQMITLALAAQAGREPGRFELATKVTTRE